MAQQNLTIYQKLTKIFGQNPEQPITSQFSVDDKEIIKAKSQEEADFKKLQAQQAKYLQNMWQRVDSEIYQQVMRYETSRIGAYADYEAMDAGTPEISAALNVFCEEATTLSEKGEMITIYSESKRIKTILDDLFYERLDITSNLPAWTRNTPIREDSMIPLLNGEIISIKEIANRLKVEPENEIWTYSIQNGTNAIVPSKIIWCDLTRRNSELIRVTLDNGTHVDTTPDHEYMLRDGSFKRADELVEGESLMPFYTSINKVRNSKLNGYERVYNPNTNRYIFTHRMVAHECITDKNYENKLNEIFLTHHKNFNKKDNHPNNLERLTFKEHALLHEKFSKHLENYRNLPEVTKKRMVGIDRYLRSDKRRERLSKEMTGIYPKYFAEYNDSQLHRDHNRIRSAKMLNNWDSKQFREKTVKGMTIIINDECLNHIKNIITEATDYIGINKLANILKADKQFILLFKSTYQLDKDIIKSINPTTLNKIILRKTNKNYLDFMVSVKSDIILNKNYIKARAIFEGKTKVKILNHKIVSVTKLNETSDVYCLEAVGKNGEQDRHNFPICSKDINGNYNRDGVIMSNCKYGDNFVFLKVGKEGEGIMGVTQLPNLEIERREMDLSDYVRGIKFSSTQPLHKKDLHFVWRDKNIEFNAWEIAHFRLLMDDKFLPYGSSILEKARRTWKQYIMMLDAMLTYRTIRAPERRVFKIFVGNMSDEDVEAYIQKIANKFRRQPIIDPKTGNIDLRYNNPLATDTDFFIPVRNDNSGTVIDTLPGATNLGEIHDIELIQNQLFTALQVPKAFLGFEEAVGEGKNLAMQDIRFTRTINRIQQAMVQELNKIAIIHLYLLGFEDELNNFELRLNNPSSQADLMKLEIWREKITTYQQCLTDVGNGFTVNSMTWAKKNILGMSNDEIINDLEQQKIEKVAAKELEDINKLKTHIFDNIDRIYAAPEDPDDKEPAKEEGGAGGGGGGGFGGGGDLGGDLGGGGEGELPEDLGTEGEAGIPGEPPEEGATPETEQPPQEEELPEQKNRKGKVISEEITNMIKQIGDLKKT